MSTQVGLPQLGESVSGGTIVAWLVGVGDTVEIDQPIAEVSTDKVDTEIPSPAAGTVTRLLADLDAEVTVGEPILELDGAAEAPDTHAELPSAPAAVGVPAASASPVAGEAPAPRDQRGAEPTEPQDGRLSPRVKRLLEEHGLTAAEVGATGSGGRLTPDDVVAAASRQRQAGLRSPLVKRLLREHGLDATGIAGTGAGGRVTPDDVRDAAAAASTTTQRPAPDRAAAPPASATTRPSAPAVASRDLPPGSRVETLTRTRSIIAERMLASLQTTAQLTAAVEADVTRVMHARSRAKDAYRARYGGSLSPLAFITRSLCRTLMRHPRLNASIDTDAGQVIYHGSVNLGIAVDAPEGLVVPNVRDAQDLTVAGLQRRITDVAERARNRKLRPEEITGGTFTVTNTGSRGSLFDTPILNPPEVGILATPTIEKRPVVVEDGHGNESIAVRHRTYLCLTYDHRLVDGADAARFLTDLAADLDSDRWDQELAELA
jgi:pyruvate dehydrogenase E2 component (dihydrolipoamide acetyltransferase)